MYLLSNHGYFGVSMLVFAGVPQLTNVWLVVLWPGGLGFEWGIQPQEAHPWPLKSGYFEDPKTPPPYTFRGSRILGQNLSFLDIPRIQNTETPRPTLPTVGWWPSRTTNFGKFFYPSNIGGRRFGFAIFFDQKWWQFLVLTRMSQVPWLVHEEVIVSWFSSPFCENLQPAYCNLGGGFKYAFFTPTCGSDPIWLIFFKGVETTNQVMNPLILS